MGPLTFCSTDLTRGSPSTKDGFWPQPAHSNQVCWLAFFESSMKVVILTKISSTYFIDEVCSFHRPSLGDLISLDLDLFCQNMIPYFLARFSNVGSSSEHALVCHDTCGKIVNSHSMILTAHHLRGHISWGPRGILGVFRPPLPRDAEICNSQVAIFVEY